MARIANKADALFLSLNAKVVTISDRITPLLFICLAILATNEQVLVTKPLIASMVNGYFIPAISDVFVTN